jgi:hypothetical protein
MKNMAIENITNKFVLRVFIINEILKAFKKTSPKVATFFVGGGELPIRTACLNLFF